MNSCVVLLVFTVLFYNSCLANETSHNKLCSVAECVNNGNTNISTAILCNGCMANILTRTDAASIFHEAQSKIKSLNENTVFRTKLAELNGDVLYLILDQLEFDDMLNLLKGYPAKKLFAVANDIYWTRYRDYVVKIGLVGRVDIDDTSKRITVGKWGVKFIRYFGRVIQHLEIEHSSTLLIQNTNKYASDSLTKLKITYIREDPFQLFKKPFTKLKAFELDVIAPINQPGHLPLNQIFPKLQRLTLASYYSIDKSFITCALPNLVHLKFIVDKMKNIENLYGMFRENPQIRSFAIDHLSQDFCNLINEHVENLENLTVSHIEVEKDTHFEYVKNLIVYSFPEKISNLTLPHLQSLEINDKVPNTWEEFAKNHQHLTHLKIYHGPYDSWIGYRELMNIINVFPNLIEIILERSNREIDDESIEAILTRNETFKKLNILSCRMTETGMNNLKVKFENDWNIDIDNFEHFFDSTILVDLSFERKN